MSKNKTPDPSDAEDYLNQLHWQSKNAYRRHMPWYLMPRWKYKPNKQNYPNPVFPRILFVGAFTFLIAYLIYSIFVHRSGFFIFILVVVLIVATILFLATRDAQNDFKDDD